MTDHTTRTTYPAQPVSVKAWLRQVQRLTKMSPNQCMKNAIAAHVTALETEDSTKPEPLKLEVGGVKSTAR